jgi:hypothetical protein
LGFFKSNAACCNKDCTTAKVPGSGLDASRMVSALTQWRRFDKQRQDLMKQQLERIINTENISKDVFEIASKSLA